jgi:sterol desaturase/sphingolipid hydroxylase (fatty acid hydroxylase superfamily)
MSAPLFECTDWKSFNRAFARRFEIRIYGTLGLVAAVLAAWFATSIWQVLVPVVVVFAFYPAFEYVAHRWLLHNTNLCRSPLTAKAWWRLHYRHHSQPRDHEVILGAPWSLVVAVSFGTIAAGLFYPSIASLAAAAAASFTCATAYEYFHSIEHAKVEVKNPYLARMRQHHLAHHYLNEQVNYGIATDIIDRLVGTHRKAGGDLRRSPTVHNLGYAGEMPARYPWVEAFDQEVNRARGGSPQDGAPREAASP